ncbi:hypothetical protein HOLleu_43725 [Holothuria leucospilota]|uniref:Integrase catalytic domain-containing protein n=1 Tax=Holothuria leucospilota TaxID=206669 RepID=A0A9Q0Y9C4_HOLLE|nr:hypothetical protein HOLleu_43725 [Holothuria leucospilota]
MKSRMRATAPVRCDSNKSGYAVHYAGNGNTEALKTFHKCWICETSTHWVDECKKLAAMSYSQRMEKIKDYHACFCCLKKAGKSHRMANCKRRKQCTEMINGKQCTYFHHPLLHKPQESVTGSVGITLNESAKAILPIVQTKMVGPKGREYTGNVLFDSGAEISLVSLSVAENLNLKAIGLPTISEEIEEIQEGIDLQRLKLEHSDVKRGSGPLDLLIGVDLGQMHSGEMRQSGNLVARHSPLGWVVFGSCQGQSTYQKSVLHVKVSEPINMTDFWSTESMGVQSQNCQCEPTKFSKLEQEEGKIISESCRKVGKQWLVPYPWCKDPYLLPDNKVQVQRTLQTTEKRLLKNPVYAEAYNNQIREMGHCLNDYWMKGPDLLNNLVGVLLRFRQYEMAACGDISKMYHRVLIPEIDQHVHRFLWRDLDIERPPDVYIKTVLTFGDKPAPAMAQTALLKTAEEGAVKYPEAAQMLKYNTYMDEICISTPSATEMTEVTNGIDKKLWQQGLDWDTELPEEDQSAWNQLFKEMEHLNNVTFERCLTPQMAKGRPILCIFSDASEDAFGACAYLRWSLTNDDEFQVRFVTAKSRVAPLKQLTIPRLELQAAVLAARLGRTIMEELTLELEKVIYLTDSTITLSWIKSQARSYKPFFSARIGEIQNLTDPVQWFHVPGEFNVADEVSRGISVNRLKDRWKQGPNFLSLPEDKWPLSKSEPDQVSDFEKRNLKAKCSKHGEVKRTGNSLTSAELEESETYWIREAQKNIVNRFENGDYKSLSPFVRDGIIRVGGRLKADFMSFETTHLVLLPQKHQVFLLITRHYHSMGHSGVACTAAKVRKKYWIIGVQRLAKSIKYKCVTCRKMDHKVETQRMANLPKERMAPYTPPFYYTSCDYFGPVTVKVGRNKTTKHYGIVFTCLNTRAVHLDLALACSSMEFIQVLRRFFAMRGQPAYILSDNGSQFVGAQKELQLMLKGWNQQELQEFCAGRGTEWKFTTPAAPHQNGCAESLVKSCKIALKRAIGDQVLTPMELYIYLSAGHWKSR